MNIYISSINSSEVAFLRNYILVGKVEKFILETNSKLKGRLKHETQCFRLKVKKCTLFLGPKLKD